MTAATYTPPATVPRKYFELSPGWWKTSLAYCFTMTLLGLRFIPAVAILLVFWVHSWRNDRYNFLIQISLFTGAFGLMNYNVLHVFSSDFAFVASIVLWLVIRKAPILRRTLAAIVLYFLMLTVFALLSVESLPVQFLIMRNWMMILYIIIPFATFAGREFSFEAFLNKTLPYVLIISIFYIFDGFILSGNVLVPSNPGEIESKFYDLNWMPLSFVSFRKYPPGLYLYALFLQPISRTHRLRRWQWTIIVLAVLATRTFSLVACLLVGYILFQGRTKLILKWFVSGAVFLVAAYTVDSFLPEKEVGTGYTESTLRIKSSLEQFTYLTSGDEEIIADFASGRMAQAIPKVELVNKEKRQWIGLGFLHPEKSHINQYVIENEYYSDISENIELATGVEIIPVQVWLNVGWLGLLGHCIFFFALWWFIRKLPNSVYFVSVIYFNIMMGLSGFMGLISISGLVLLSLSYAAVILPERPHLPGYTKPWGKMPKRTGRRRTIAGS